MKNQINKISFSICIAICTILISPTYAQKITATLKPNGEQYQIIQIPQSFRGIIGADIGKIRIKDTKGNDVPFILKEDKIAVKSLSKVNFKITNTDSTDVIVIENTAIKRRTNYIVKIANSTANKKYKIEGSTDNNKWFSLVSNGNLSDNIDPSQTFIHKSTDFPINDYKFIRIIIDNNKTAPLNIIDIFEAEIAKSNITLDRLEKISFKNTLNKENKTSNISITKNGVSSVDRIVFNIKSPKDYNREAMLFNVETLTNKGKQHTIEQNVQHFQLNSKASSIIDLSSNDYPSEINIVIQNNDNPPLKIDDIQLFQKKLEIIANLDDKDSYTLLADDSWQMPNYDLQNIDLNLTNELPIATISNVTEIKASEVAQKINPFNNKWILMICSILGVIIIFYFGNSLLKDMKKNNSN